MFRLNAVLRGGRLWLAIACLGFLAVFLFLYSREAQLEGANPRVLLGQGGDHVKHFKIPSMTFEPWIPTEVQTTTTRKTTKTTTTTTPAPPKVTVVRIPDNATLQTWSHIQLHKFYHRYINSPQIPCSGVERMGQLKDGGWEMCDDPLYRPPDRRNCLVYSFGINYDFSYDDDIAEYGCEVHAFDPSMQQADDHVRGERVHFHKLGIGDRDNAKFQAGNGVVWTLHSLKGFRKMLGHEVGRRRVDIVKMDVEGHELLSLTQALEDGSLADVRQLSFETHVSWAPSDATREEYIKFLELLRGVYDAGFRIFTTHRNHVWSAFTSLLTGKDRAHCHEVHTVNVNLRQRPPTPTPRPLPPRPVVRASGGGVSGIRNDPGNWKNMNNDGNNNNNVNGMNDDRVKNNNNVNGDIINNNPVINNSNNNKYDVNVHNRNSNAGDKAGGGGGGDSDGLIVKMEPLP